jgi:serine/threonine-protein kinase
MRYLTEDIAELPTIAPEANKPPSREVLAAETLQPTPRRKASAASPKPVVLPAERLGELSGTVLAHFQVGPVLARGRSGVVFRARDVERERDVALKVLRPEFSRNAKEMQRFIRAMKTMLPLRHPNLVTLYGAGKKGPYCWIAMEYIEGESLTKVIQRIGVAGMLDWRHAFRIAVHLARGLQFAHEQHVVHRNLTPQNVMVRSDDKLAKLGDLMLAKALEGTLAENITRPGEILGDVCYMSPERTRGIEEVDERSDLYSLGALIYALLTGHPPFEGYSMVETITQIRQATPEKPRTFQLSIPERLEGTVLTLLAKRPENRFQTATELLADLERIAKYQGLSV